MDLNDLEPDLLEHSFVRTQETVDFQPSREEKQWEAIRDECESGGAMDTRCSIVAASLGTGNLDVVSKKLRCGCVLVPVDGDGLL